MGVNKGKKGKSKKIKIGHKNFEANKKRRAEKQKRILERQSSQKALRLSMEEDVRAKFPNKSHSQLRKKFGTLTISRMLDILDDRWEQAQWYINRQALHAARAASMKKSNGKPHRKKKRFGKKPKTAKQNLKTKKVQKVSTGPAK